MGAFNGSGTFVRSYSWQTDAANSVPITASRMDAEDNGFASGLSNCLTRDGQSPALSDIPMGGHKITGLANGTATTDALTLGQLAGTSGSNGAALVGFSPSVTYPAGTVGAQVQAIFTIVNTTGNWLNAIVFSEGVGYDTYNSVSQQPLTVNSTTTHTVPRVAESVEMNALGSGANGPARADIGRSVFIGKDNYPTAGNIGEIDGLTINVRQRNGDCSGILIDSRTVSGSSADFNACFEGVAWQTDSAGAGVSSIRAFAGINSGTGGTDGMPIKGFAATATSGSGQVGYYVAQSGGTFASAFRYDDFGGHNVFMVLGDGTPTVGNKGTAASRYFDFYTSGVTTNYDVRLAASGGTATDGKGTLTVVANYLMLGAGGIGLTLPEVAIGNVTTPASGFATIFVDAADKKPKIKDSTGTVTAFF